MIYINADTPSLAQYSQHLLSYGSCRIDFAGPGDPPRERTVGASTTEQHATLYSRLGGYDTLTAVVDDLLVRLNSDPALGRFWAHRGEDGIAREKQLLIDFLAASAGGPVYYTGRDMALSHKGMRISDSDWAAFSRHLEATLDAFDVPEPERGEVLAFIESTRADIVEA